MTINTMDLVLSLNTHTMGEWNVVDVVEEGPVVKMLLSQLYNDRLYTWSVVGYPEYMTELSFCCCDCKSEYGAFFDCDIAKGEIELLKHCVEEAIADC